MGFNDEINAGLSIWFDAENTIPVYYNGSESAIRAHFQPKAALDRRSGVQRAEGELEVQVSDVDSPSYRDTVAIDGVDWTVSHIIQGDGYTWTVAVYNKERPVF